MLLYLFLQFLVFFRYLTYFPSYKTFTSSGWEPLIQTPHQLRHNFKQNFYKIRGRIIRSYNNLCQSLQSVPIKLSYCFLFWYMALTLLFIFKKFLYLSFHLSPFLHLVIIIIQVPKIELQFWAYTTCVKKNNTAITAAMKVINVSISGPFGRLKKLLMHHKIACNTSKCMLKNSPLCIEFTCMNGVVRLPQQEIFFF